jgi:hypothetical protein
MSCGNRFQCGLKKPSRFQFQPDKPSNPELHNENQKRLNDLLKAREEIDKQFLTSNIKISEMSNSESLPLKSTGRHETTAMTVHMPEALENVTYEPWSNNSTNDSFTPWKIPSATDYQAKPK